MNQCAVSVRRWSAWACILVVVYVSIASMGWHRVLIPDEIRPLLLTAKSIDRQMAHAKGDLVHTPLSYLVARCWMNTFGHSDASAKLLALSIGMFTIILFTYLSTLMSVQWRVLSMLFCVPYFRLGSSVNLVRMYGILLLLVVAALIVWEQWRKSSGHRWLIAWIFLMALAVYSHPSALLLLPAFVVANGLFGRRQVAFLAGAIVPVLALVPWLMYVLPVFLDRGITANVTGGIDQSATLALAKLPFYALSGENAGGGSLVPVLHRFYPRRTVLNAAAVVIHVLPILAAVGVVRREWPPHRDGDRDVRWMWIAIILIACPVTILYAFSLLYRPVIHARYFIVALPAYWLVITPLARFGHRLIFGAILFGWLAVSVVLLFSQHTRPSALYSAINHVADRIEPSDLVVCDQHMPIGWQVYWEWTRRLQRPDEVLILSSEILEWLRGNPPGTDLDDMKLDGVTRVWFFHLPKTQRVTEIGHFLRGRGFVADENYQQTTSAQGSVSHSLTLFRRESKPISPR